MELSNKPILPGSIVVVKDVNSIYRGYKGFVQRVTNKTAAGLFEGGNWDKLVTFELHNLEFKRRLTYLLSSIAPLKLPSLNFLSLDKV